jgi:hypothetical protein
MILLLLSAILFRTCKASAVASHLFVLNDEFLFISSLIFSTPCPLKRKSFPYFLVKNGTWYTSGMKKYFFRIRRINDPVPCSIDDISVTEIRDELKKIGVKTRLKNREFFLDLLKSKRQ